MFFYIFFLITKFFPKNLKQYIFLWFLHIKKTISDHIFTWSFLTMATFNWKYDSILLQNQTIFSPLQTATLCKKKKKHFFLQWYLFVSFFFILCFGILQTVETIYPFTSAIDGQFNTSTFYLILFSDKFLNIVLKIT